MEKVKRIKIIVVDDEPTVVEVICRYLRKMGCQAMGAQGALEAFSLLNQIDPNLWIVDIKMPGLSGLDLAAMIRESTPSAGIFLMTGYPDNEICEKIRHLNVIKLIEKPIDPTVFHEILSLAGHN